MEALKKMITFLMMFASVFAYAQETHSIQFKCVDGEETKYIMVGNKFGEDDPSYDWSNEIYVVKGDQYRDSSYRSTTKFTIASDTPEKLIAVNIEKPSELIIFDKAYNLTVQAGEDLDHYVCHKQTYPDDKISK